MMASLGMKSHCHSNPTGCHTLGVPTEVQRSPWCFPGHQHPRGAVEGWAAWGETPRPGSTAALVQPRGPPAHSTFRMPRAVKHSPGTSNAQDDRGGLGTLGGDVPQVLCLGMKELQHHRSIRWVSVVGFNRECKQGRSNVEKRKKGQAQAA